MVLADIVSGEVDWADIVFLAAVIVAIVAAVLSFQARNVMTGLSFVVLGLIALGWLLL